MAIYVARGLKPALAKEVAEQLMAHDALGAHARDELGISDTFRARPIQAALASAGSFAVGAAMPLFVSAMAPAEGFDSSCLWNVTGVPRALGRVGRTCGWRRSGDRSNTRNLLGCARDGADRMRRVTVRNSCLSGAIGGRRYRSGLYCVLWGPGPTKMQMSKRSGYRLSSYSTESTQVSRYSVVRGGHRRGLLKTPGAS
jgi:hypothetical protein